jgi:Pyridine nucleotide-disulphide oxidoreductase
VIVGAGFAGLNAAHALRRADADVTIVDGHDYHTFQPLLYQVSTGYLAPEEVGAGAILLEQPPATRHPDHRGRSHACSCDTRCNERPWHSPADGRFFAIGSDKQ